MAAWFAPEAFRPLDLSAVPDVGLMLPFKTNLTSSFIIGYLENDLWAIDYSQNAQYQAFKCEDDYNYTGLYISNLQIEIDLTSAFDFPSSRFRYGALVRATDKLYVVGSLPYQPGHTCLLRLVEGLEVGGSKDGVGFSKWRIKVGDDDERNFVLDFDLSA
jgi:hypothetical protein